MFPIPFTQAKGFRPKTSIPDNLVSDAPVEFDLRMASGPDQARCKSLLTATAGMALALEHWTPEVQRNVTSALLSSSELFIGTVGAVRNLRAPAILCRLVGIVVPDKAQDDDLFPIDTGVKFARVATYMPFVAMEVAFEISQLTQRAQLDPRFFGSPSGSGPSGAKPNGSATPAPPTSAGTGTAESPTPTDA